jgi:glutamate synthase domain-containing protein 3
VYDPEQHFDRRCNLDMVDLELIEEEEDRLELKEMIRRHYQYTGSRKAHGILKNWEASLPLFIKIFPMEYRRVLGMMSKEDQATEREEVQHG